MVSEGPALRIPPTCTGWLVAGAAILSLSACGAPGPAVVDAGDFRFQTQRFDDAVGRPEALWEGELAIDQAGCVYGLRSRQGDDGGDSLVFPEGTQALPEGEGLVLPEGQELRFGDPVELGGGYSTGEASSDAGEDTADGDDQQGDPGCPDHGSAFLANPEQPD